MPCPSTKWGQARMLIRPTYPGGRGGGGLQAHRADKGAQMRSAYNSHWWARMLGPRPAYGCVAASKSSEVTGTWPP